MYRADISELPLLEPEPKQLGPPFRIEAFAAEFFGTFFLVVTVGISALHDAPLQPLAVGFMLMAMIASTATVSGGHFNPAVTLGVQLLYPMDVLDACLYVFSQLGGGLVAGHVYLLLGTAVHLGPGSGYSMTQVFFAEAMFSASLVLVVLAVVASCKKVDDPRLGNQYGAMAVGMTVAASGFGISAISGCSLNPAVAFGLGISNWLHAGGGLHHLGCYLLSPLLGALLAAAMFYVLQPKIAKRVELPPLPTQVPEDVVQDPSPTMSQRLRASADAPRPQNSLFLSPMLRTPEYYEEGPRSPASSKRLGRSGSGPTSPEKG
eukprot:TRINITY_DN122739_c0_g1_i1.p1 TRINITY_DN122739_c0_g1~~TRINITY_DN122739_c0_g1_i1.p1  ORF type:complete len:320 (+),score=66.97 TRINITY_DN122739_c0_g1_i1:85-1044(+)